ncbi:EpsG family protein [Leuconostoc lactis]|uniref:EpsG family protein n=1 Tax=Leuconostoc lactis TaxID=1246 RepID=UPI001D104F38|nr:EpsG family protein [Leuconostoc lactis]MCC2744916.1 EpsG family protein [Leuconostoc lactis]
MAVKATNFIIVLMIMLYAIIKIILNQDAGKWGTDQVSYYYHYFLPLRNITWHEFYTQYSLQREFGFRFILWLISNIKSLNFLEFQIITFFIEILPVYFISKFINKGRELDIILFTFLVYPFFANGATNVLRQGLAISILMIGYLWTLKDLEESTKIRIISLGFVFFATTFHQTALILSALWVLTIVFRKKIRTKYYWATFLIFAILDITNTNQVLFGTIGSLFSDNYDLYTNTEVQASYGLGSKYMFVLISIFLAVALNFLLRRVNEGDKLKAELLFKQYLGSTSAFFAFSFIAFSDRVGMYAWAIAPMIAFYMIDKTEDSLQRRIHLVLIPIVCMLIGYGMSSGSYFVNR